MPTTTLGTLKEAQRILQGAHDQIETYGFDISEYGSRSGPCCYIGAIRVGADVSPFPVQSTEEDENGDSVESLRVALELADKQAEREAELLAAHLEFSAGSREPGRTAENFGFLYRSETTDEDKERSEALKLFREALRDVHGKIERAERAAA